MKTVGIAVATLCGVGIATLILFCILGRDPLSAYVLVDKTWTPNDFNTFLEHCDNKKLDALAKSLKVDDTTKSYQEASTTELKKELLRQSSHLITRPFKDFENIDYHGIVKWVAGKCSVPKELIETAPTFVLERHIVEFSFKDIWDSLSAKQRTELIQKIDTQNKLSSAEIAELSGTAALTALSTTVYFTGFAFYTTMSTVISATAGFLGLTVPFAAYAGASTTAAILSGPIGWGLIAIGAAGSLAILGKANWKNCMAFIVQLHFIKVEALQQSGISIK